jgi:phage-related holin
VGAAGFWRKVALFFALAFGIFLDAFIPLMFGVVAVDLPFKMPVGMIIGCYIVINESISIFENLDDAAPTALPKWIKKLLKGAGKTIEDGGQTNDKNQSSNT